jgi:hypothetical protein
MFILPLWLISVKKGSATGCFYNVDDYLELGEIPCRFMNITAKAAIRILNIWYLAARNRTALPAKVKKYPN